MLTKRILALDLGTKTGWAFGMPGRSIESGVENFKVRRGESPGMLYFNFRTWLQKMLPLMMPHLVVYEMIHHRGGAATEILHGFLTRVKEECALQKRHYKPIDIIGDSIFDYTFVHSSSLKKFATGKGNASKDEMIRAAQVHFPEIIIVDDNHADALWILAWAEQEYCG